jgi:hypothetical protein
LPSWVPDWSHWTFLWCRGIPMANEFRAAGETQMDITCDNEALVVHGLRVDRVGFHIGKSFLELADLTDEELDERWFTNMTNYKEEFDAEYPSGNAYTRAIRWTLVVERYVIARLGKLEDASLRDVEIFFSWLTGMNDFYSYIDEVYPSGCSYHEAICRTLLAAKGRSYSSLEIKLEDAITLPSDSPVLKKVFYRFLDYVAPQSYYITEKGYIGLAPDNVRAGDTLAVFRGGNTPYIIRQKDGGSSYEFIGETYTYGLMDGEAFEIGDAGECVFSLL